MKSLFLLFIPFYTFANLGNMLEYQVISNNEVVQVIKIEVVSKNFDGTYLEKTTTTYKNGTIEQKFANTTDHTYIDRQWADYIIDYCYEFGVPEELEIKGIYFPTCKINVTHPILDIISDRFKNIKEGNYVWSGHFPLTGMAKYSYDGVIHRTIDFIWR